MAKDEVTIMFEDAKLKFINFEGRAGMYNREGKRSFTLEVDQATGEQLLNDNWNVKMKPSYEDPDVLIGQLEVSVEYKNKPPRVIVLTNGGKTRTLLDEETVGSLDMAEIETIDVLIRAYDWVVNENSGRKAYLKTAYVTIYEDDLDRKYADR